MAVTDRAALMVTEHVAPDAASHPAQPVRTEPEDGVAVRVTVVPLAYGAEQVAPQLIPAGLELTLPLPVPCGITVSVGSWPTVSVVVPLFPNGSVTVMVV